MSMNKYASEVLSSLSKRYPWEDVFIGSVKECMEGAFKQLLPNVPFKVEPVIRETWGV